MEETLHDLKVFLGDLKRLESTLSKKHPRPYEDFLEDALYEAKELLADEIKELRIRIKEAFRGDDDV